MSCCLCPRALWGLWQASRKPALRELRLPSRRALKTAVSSSSCDKLHVRASSSRRAWTPRDRFRPVPSFPMKTLIFVSRSTRRTSWGPEADNAVVVHQAPADKGSSPFRLLSPTPSGKRQEPEQLLPSARRLTCCSNRLQERIRVTERPCAVYHSGKDPPKGPAGDEGLATADCWIRCFLLLES